MVIGGSRGIGRAIVERFAGDGAAVVFSYVQREQEATALAQLIERQGGRAVPVRADLGNAADIRRLFDTAENALGGLDIVVANAAIAVIKPMVELTEADFDRVFTINAKGTFVALQEAARRVRAGGRIIATSTGGTQMLMTQTSLYLGSKGAVEQFVRVLARELGERGITVNAVSPGYTDTELLPERDRAAGCDPRAVLPSWRVPGRKAAVRIFERQAKATHPSPAVELRLLPAATDCHASADRDCRNRTNSMEHTGSDYHHELLHGQDVVLPSNTQWQEICAVGVLEGTQVPLRELIQNWLHSWAEFQAAQLGATKIRDRWVLVPLLVLKGRYYRVHFEDVVCEHCDRRCGPSATPESVSYACTGLTPAQIRAEFDTLPIKACPHCGGLLRRRQTIWLAADEANPVSQDAPADAATSGSEESR